MVDRFDLKARVEHLGQMIVFTLLVVTGLPQRWPEEHWAQIVTSVFGGIESMRWIHRGTGLVFTGLVFFHFSVAFADLLRRSVDVAIVPTRKDFTDAIAALKYQLGLSEEHPKYDRFEYKQKFEYWGVAFGGMIMISTGFILLFPSWTTWFLPGQFVPMAKVAHGSEALMAFLVILIWHIYNAHLSPEVFPFDKGMFHGKMSRERMEHEHPLELARLDAQSKAEAQAEKPS
jgi:cytochrome b subunit of formate dehydrogenase